MLAHPARVLAFLALSTPFAAAQNWTFDVMAQTGVGGLLTIDSSCSMNDAGTVAFAGTDATGSRVFVSSTPGVATAIKDAQAGHTWAGASVSHKGGASGPYVVSRRLETGPQYFIIRYDSLGLPSQLGTVIGSSTGVLPDFDSALLFVDVNSSGVVTFPGLINGATQAGLFSGSGGIGSPQLIASYAPASTNVRPQISESGLIAIRDNLTRIVLWPASGGLPDVVASGAVGGFTAVGREPGISSDGSVVAFIGNRGSGEGVFLSVLTPAGRQIVGISGDGIADGFTDFDELQRAGVASEGNFSSTPSLMSAFVKTVTVAFVGTKSGTTGVYAKTVGIKWNGSSLETRTAQESRVVALNETIGGKQVSALRVYRPVNAARSVCFHATFSAGGGSAVVRAKPPVREARISFKRVTNALGNSPWATTPATFDALISGVNALTEPQLGLRFQWIDVTDVKESQLYDVDLLGNPDLAMKNLETALETDPCRYRWRADAINVYLTNKITNPDFGGYGPLGYAGPDENSLILFPFDGNNGAKGLAHEIGHYFGLLHPFATFIGDEPSGSCATPSPDGLNKGDLVDDTPEDPNDTALLNSQYATCASVFNAVKFDVMSYYSGVTTANGLFTTGQKNRAWGIGVTAHPYVFVDGPPAPTLGAVTPSFSPAPGPVAIALAGVDFPAASALSVRLNGQVSSGVTGNATSLNATFASPIAYGAHCVCLRKDGDLIASLAEGITVALGAGTPGCSGPHTLAGVETTVGSSTMHFTGTNAPTFQLGLLLIYDEVDPSAVDPFGIGVPVYADLFTLTLFYGLNIFSDGAGNAQSVNMNVPEDAAFYGREYYAQALWYWPGGPCVPSVYGLSISPAIPFRIY